MIAALVFAPNLALAALPAVSFQQAAEIQDLGAKLQGGLVERMQSAAPGELLPVDIVLLAQAPQSEIQALTVNPDKRARRAAVTSLLKTTAEASQGDLYAFLQAERAKGGVGERIDRLWIANVITVHASSDVILRLAQRDDVSYVHYDPPRGEEVLLSRPAAGGGQEAPTCGLTLIGAPTAWSSLGITGRGVVVGVIDTGLCATHPDIANQRWLNGDELPNGVDDDGNGFIDDFVGWNFESNNNNTGDTFSHGSHVSGTVAGDGTSGTACGVAPDARIMSLKFFNSFSGEQSVWSSMQYGVANGADILTASLGWPHSVSPNRAMWRAVCDNSIAAGVVVIYAAGNEGCGTQIDNVRTPGDVPGVITVGAVACNDVIASFSSCGPVSWTGVAPYNDHPFPPGLMKPDVSAPGVSTTSHSLCSGYTNFDGTSMATPHVAGLSALILEADPTLDHFGVKAILESTSLDLGTAGKDKFYGSGRIRAVNAVQAALANGNHCAAKLNSCGSLPLITMTGTPSATMGSGHIISASNTSGTQIGLLIYTDAGPTNIPFLGGSLCLNAVRRTVPVTDIVGTNGQCNGVLAIDMNLFRSGSLGGNPIPSLSIPGTTIHCQWWGRDTLNSFGVLLSAAFGYDVGP